MTLEEIRSEADALPSKERGDLASHLISSLGRPDYDVSDEEVLRRCREMEDGTVQGISHEELMQRLGRPHRPL